MAERTELGRRIAAACALRGISMTTLADRIGVARNTLSRIVTGETADPASGIMVKIAKELRVSLDFLFALSEDLNPSELEAAAVAVVGAEDHDGRNSTPLRAARRAQRDSIAENGAELASDC